MQNPLRQKTWSRPQAIDLEVDAPASGFVIAFASPKIRRLLSFGTCGRQPGLHYHSYETYAAPEPPAWMQSRPKVRSAIRPAHRLTARTVEIDVDRLWIVAHRSGIEAWQLAAAVLAHASTGIVSRRAYRYG